MLISGFLEEDVGIIFEAATQLGLSLITKKNKGKWFMMHLRK